MKEMIWSLSAFYLLLCLSAKCADSSVAVQLEPQHLTNVSHSVLTAETWLRNRVLSLYPLSNITTIVVGHNILCTSDETHNLPFLLPSLKNIHYSLTRWGLQNDIKVTTSLSSNCLDSTSGETYRADVGEKYIKPILAFLQETQSPYVVNLPNHFPTAVSENESVKQSHLTSMKNLGDFHLDIIDSNALIVSFPPQPTPIISPSHSSHPGFASGIPLPPLVGTVTPPPAVAPTNPPFLPHFAPMATPPFGPHLPPCNPSHGGGGAPVGAPTAYHAVWCVAKPSVPPETLQEALDYACGEGGADCEAIGREGSCYYPDTVVAHASYAFNSYWQKSKRDGGSCSFGGTAMLINSDPSYRNCRFVIT